MPSPHVYLYIYSLSGRCFTAVLVIKLEPRPWSQGSLHRRSECCRGKQSSSSRGSTSSPPPPPHCNGPRALPGNNGDLVEDLFQMQYHLGSNGGGNGSSSIIPPPTNFEDLQQQQQLKRPSSASGPRW